MLEACECWHHHVDKTDGSINGQNGSTSISQWVQNSVSIQPSVLPLQKSQFPSYIANI